MTKFDFGKLGLVVGIVLLALAALKFFVFGERPVVLLVLGLLNLALASRTKR